MAEGRRGGKKGRKYGRNARKPKTKRYHARYMTMQGMMGRKIRNLMRSNCMTEGQAIKHWKANRKRGRVLLSME